jgi:hypothetical protein
MGYMAGGNLNLIQRPTRTLSLSRSLHQSINQLIDRGLSPDGSQLAGQRPVRGNYCGPGAVLARLGVEELPLGVLKSTAGRL